MNCAIALQKRFNTLGDYDEVAATTITAAAGSMNRLQNELDSGRFQGRPTFLGPAYWQ
jgi:hypothetical protein